MERLYRVVSAGELLRAHGAWPGSRSGFPRTRRSPAPGLEVIHEVRSGLRGRRGQGHRLRRRCTGVRGPGPHGRPAARNLRRGHHRDPAGGGIHLRADAGRAQRAGGRQARVHGLHGGPRPLHRGGSRRERHHGLPARHRPAARSRVPGAQVRRGARPSPLPEREVPSPLLVRRARGVVHRRSLPVVAHRQARHRGGRGKATTLREHDPGGVPRGDGPGAGARRRRHHEPGDPRPQPPDRAPLPRRLGGPHVDEHPVRLAGGRVVARLGNLPWARRLGPHDRRRGRALELPDRALRLRRAAT